MIEILKCDLPVYHTRATRKEFMSTYGHFTDSTKPFVLCTIYQELTVDESEASTTSEAAIDE